MTCSKCESNNINIQAVTETVSKRKHRSIIMWIILWWWIEILLWLFLTIPRLLIMMFAPKKQKIISKTKKMAICQNCGNSWDVN